MHPLVEVLFLDVDMAVEMDDADALGGAFGDAAHAREADGMVAAEHHRQRAGGEDVADAAGDLVEALLQVGRDGEHVARVAQRHLLAQIDAHLVIIGRVERGNAPDALRAEARAGAIGGAAVEGNADDRRVIFADIADILDIGRLQKRVDAGEMRQLAAREGGDGLVGEAIGAGQAHVERPLLLAPPAVLGQPPFGLDGLPAARLAGVEIGMMGAAQRRA